MFIAEIALVTGRDIKVAKTYIFNFCTCGLGTGQGLAQKQVAVAVHSGACRDAKNFNAHKETSLVDERNP
jgi:hypothetical protein